MRVGDPVPGFILQNQAGDAVDFKERLGKVIVMNFIFTRCGMPTLCPAATQKMKALQGLVKDEGLQGGVQFITISFDPKNDTSEVLQRYAEGFKIDLLNYEFLTGDEEVIKRLVKAFGVFTVNEKGTINHTMKTVVIDKEGILRYENTNADWDPKIFLEAIKKFKKV